MAKIVKRKRRKVRLSGFAILLFTFALISWLITSLFVNTINASLTMKIQSMNEELEQLNVDNKSLNYEIQTLENKDRVYELASATNMDQIQDNIIAIVGE